MISLEKIKQNATGKRLAVFAALFIVMFLPMNLVVSDWKSAEQTTLMDFIIGGYGTDQVYAILNTIGAIGRHFYLHMLCMDCLFGILYTLFLSTFVALALKKCPGISRGWNLLIVLPLLGMLSDWTENLMTVIDIHTFPAIGSTAVAVSSVATTLKYSFLALAFLAGIVVYIVGLYKSKKVKVGA